MNRRSLIRLLGRAGATWLIAALLVVAALAAAIQLVLDRFVLSQPKAEAKVFDGRGELSVVRYAVQELTQDVRKQLREKPESVERADDAVEDAIESLAADLDSLLARAASGAEARG